MNGNELDIEYFNKFSDGYSPYSTSDIDLMINSILPYIAEGEGVKICEIGCASGQFSVELNKFRGNADFYGVDIAEKVLEKYPFNKVHASAFSIPIEDGFFDVICFPASLHHILPYEKSLIEAKRLLKKDGIIFCLEPNFYHPHRMFFMRFSKLYQYITKINDYPINPFKLKKFFNSIDCKTEKLQFVNIEFNGTSMLQSFQNKIYHLVKNNFLVKLLSPWFIIVVKKQ